MERTCSAPGCANTPRSGKAELCQKHYHRLYRHGSIERTARVGAPSVSKGRRYRLLYLPGHPLANPRHSRVYEHRAVLYDTIGPGPHPCRWCGVMLDWLPGVDPLAIHADHLNGYGDDNRPENLVPSCRNCNPTRGVQAKARALRGAGWWSRNDTIARLRAGGRVPEVER